eukprot:SAG31_NODE_761_length_12276_cov_4.530673_9_plen_55_part_00
MQNVRAVHGSHGHDELGKRAGQLLHRERLCALPAPLDALVEVPGVSAFLRRPPN